MKVCTKADKKKHYEKYYAGWPQNLESWKKHGVRQFRPDKL